jgi:hypothetical protein
MHCAVKYLLSIVHIYNYFLNYRVLHRSTGVTQDIVIIVIVLPSSFSYNICVITLLKLL